MERPGKREMRLRVGELGTVEIGVQGEVEAREIILDVSEWLELWPDAVFLITHRRPTEYAAYNAAQVELRDGGQLCWTIGAEDVAIAGRGEIQVRAYEQDTLVKSISGRTVIRPGVGAGEAPEAAEDWLEKVSKAGAEATRGAEDARMIAERLAQILYGVLWGDVFTGTQEEWDAFLDSLVLSLDQAKNAAAEAEASAEEVAGYMEQAESYRAEYSEKLNALAAILRSIRHKTTEEHPGWVEIEMEGLEEELLQKFPTIAELAQTVDELRETIRQAQTATAQMNTLRTTVQGERDRGAYDGKDGTDGFVVRGTYKTLDALKAAVKTPSAGDAYGVGENENYSVYLWDAVEKTWVSWGALTGGRSGIDEEEFAALFDERFKLTFDTQAAALMKSGGFQQAVAASLTDAWLAEVLKSDVFLSAVSAQVASAMEVSFREAFIEKMKFVNLGANAGSEETLAFRQAVYDAVFPVGCSFTITYGDPKNKTYGDAAVPKDPATIAHEMGLAGVQWVQRHDATMGYVNGVGRYAVGVYRYTRTA